MLKIGFVGLGGMGQCAHLKHYATLPDCQVVAAAELRPRLAERVAARWGIPRVYADHQAMLAAEQLDALVAIQPFAHHGRLLPDLLGAGVPILIEKPLASSVEVGEQIVATLADSGTWLMVGYHKRSDPATAYAKAEIERLKQTHELGDLKYVRLTMPAGDWVAGGFSDLLTTDESVPPIENDPPAGDLDPPGHEQYVTFVNYYIHQVNLLRWLLGEPYRVTYAAPSGVLLAVESHSGLTGTIEMSPYNTTLDWQEKALVCFERGYVELGLPAPLSLNRPGSVELLRDPGPGTVPEVLRPILPPVDAMRQQAINFLRAVRGEMAPLTEAPEALEDLRVAREYLRLWKGI